MRIAYCSAFYPYRGGIAQFNGRLYRALEQRHEIAAYTFTRQYPNILFPGTTQLVADGDTADAIPSFRTLDSIAPWTYFSTAHSILSRSPQLYLSKYWIPFLAPALGTVARLVRRKGVPTIGILGNVLPHEKRPGDEALATFFLNSHDAFIVMSEADALHLQRLAPKAPFRIREHPIYDQFGTLISPAQAKQALDVPQHKKILLFFGFIRDYKGLDVAIQSLKHLPEEYHLLIGGECYGSFEPYQKLIEQNNLQHRITLHNRYIDDNEVATFFSAADVTLLPYKSATQSGITKISFHFSMPVIVTDVGGLKEAVAPYKTGIVADVPEPEEVAAAVRRFFDTLPNEDYVHNIRNYNSLHSWAAYAEEVESLYEEVLNMKKW